MQLFISCIGPTAVRERFLEATVAAEEALLAKLVDLPNQHVLLVLRQCLQQNLRHLQRSLQSDDLQHLWKRLDESLADSMHRIGSAVSPAPSLAVDNARISLPVKLSGIGILSFKICVPVAFAAAPEALDTLLASLLDQNIDTVNQTVLSKRERCQESFPSQQGLPPGVAGPTERQNRHGSFLPARNEGLSIMPFSPALRLTDIEPW